MGVVRGWVRDGEAWEAKGGGRGRGEAGGWRVVGGGGHGGRREIVVRKRGREERQGGGRDGVEGGEGGNVMARLATGGAPT